MKIVFEVKDKIRSGEDDDHDDYCYGDHCDYDCEDDDHEEEA